jgi:hypothetical protein
MLSKLKRYLCKKKDGLIQGLETDNPILWLLLPPIDQTEAEAEATKGKGEAKGDEPGSRKKKMRRIKTCLYELCTMPPIVTVKPLSAAPSAPDAEDDVADVADGTSSKDANDSAAGAQAATTASAHFEYRVTAPPQSESKQRVGGKHGSNTMAGALQWMAQLPLYACWQEVEMRVEEGTLQPSHPAPTAPAPTALAAAAAKETKLDNHHHHHHHQQQQWGSPRFCGRLFLYDAPLEALLLRASRDAQLTDQGHDQPSSRELKLMNRLAQQQKEAKEREEKAQAENAALRKLASQNKAACCSMM